MDHERLHNDLGDKMLRLNYKVKNEKERPEPSERKKRTSRKTSSSDVVFKEEPFSLIIDRSSESKTNKAAKPTMTFENALSETDELNDDIMLSSSSANVSQKTNQRSKTLPRLPSSEQGVTKPKQKTQSLTTSPTAITRPHSLWKHGEHSPRHMSVPAPRIQQATLLQPTFFPTSLPTSELPGMDNTDHQWPQASQHKLYFNTDPQSLNNVFDNPSENQSLSSNVVSSHQEKNSAPDAIENNSKMWQSRAGNQGSWADFPTSFNGVFVSNEKPWTEKAVVCEDDNIHASKRERSSSHSSISSNSSEGDIAETEESVWKINNEQKAYYLNQFRILQPAEMGVVSGQKAREFFLKSGLGMDVLSKIWNLADLDADGALDFDEFCIAMHIVVAVRHGLEVPQFLPLHLVPEKYEKQSSSSIPQMDANSQGLSPKDSGQPWARFSSDSRTNMEVDGPEAQNNGQLGISQRPLTVDVAEQSTNQHISPVSHHTQHVNQQHALLTSQHVQSVNQHSVQSTNQHISPVSHHTQHVNQQHALLTSQHVQSVNQHAVQSSQHVDPAVQHVQQSGNVTQNLVQQGQVVTQQDQTAQKESPQAVQPKQPITQQGHGQLQRTKSDSNSADENLTPHRKISLGIPRVRGQPRQKSLLDTPHWAILPPPSKFTTDTPEEVVRSGQFVPTGTIITAEPSDRSERAGLERTAPMTRGYSDSDSSSSENDQPKDIRGRDQSRDIDSVSSSSSHSSSNALRASRESVDGENRLPVVAPVPPPRRKPAHSRSSSLDLQKLFNKGGNSLSLQKHGDHGKDTSQGNQENFANFEDFDNKVENLTRASENPPRFGHRRSASLDSTHSASVEQPSQPTTTEDVKVQDVSNINSRFHSPGSVPRPVPRKKAGGPPPPLNRQDNSSDSIPEKEKKISKEPIHFVVRPVTRLEQLHAKIRDLKSKNTRLSKINNDLQQEVKEMMEARVSLESSLEQLKPFPK